MTGVQTCALPIYIIIITESWLHEGITDGLLDPQCLFNVFRSDRTHGRGGGVCVLISNCLPVIAIILIYCLISSLTQPSPTIAYIDLILYALNLFLSVE